MEEERKIVTVGKMSTELIVGFFVYGIVYGIIYYLLINFLAVLRIESLIVTAIISIILQGIFAFLTWKWNISATLKKRTITKDKVPAIMRDLYIFTIILCVVTAIFNFRKVDMNLDYEINTELKLEGIYRNSSDYQEQKELVTKEVKKGLYTYLAVLEVGLFVVYIGVILLQKKRILENSIDE